MSACQECRSAFEEKRSDKARFVDEQIPVVCGCEACTVSEHSPGVVDPDEFLIRIVVDPCQVTDKDGVARPRSTVVSEAATIGASCLRETHAEPGHFIETVEELLKARPRDAKGRARGVFGVIRFRAGLAQAIEETLQDKENKEPPRQERRFCVYDTAREDRRSHADVMFTKHRQPGRSREERFIGKLYEAVRDGFIPVDQFMEGLLEPYTAANREIFLAKEGM